MGFTAVVNAVNWTCRLLGNRGTFASSTPMLPTPIAISRRKPLTVQTKAVEQFERIGCDIQKGICTSLQPDRIALHIPPNTWIVIAEVVVMQPCLRVAVL